MKPQHLQIQKQSLQGGVNDLALTHLDSQLIAVSGGSDAKVKVWSVATSELLFCFTGVQAFGALPASCRQDCAPMFCALLDCFGPDVSPSRTLES